MSLDQHTACTFIVSTVRFYYVYCSHTPLQQQGGDNKGGHKDEVGRLVETLALGSVGNSTRKNYLAKWNTWIKERQAQGREPWLHTLADLKEVLSDLPGFMAFRFLCIIIGSLLLEDT